MLKNNLMKRYLDSKYLVYENGDIQNEKTKRILKPQSNGNGYLKVTLTIKGNQIQRYVHRLVAYAYLPNSWKEQINHKDGDKSNNHFTNLEWVTNQENRTHAVESGMIPSGEECYNSKLSKENITVIFKMEKDGILRYKIAEFFNVSRSTISEILNGNRYKNLYHSLTGKELTLKK